MSMPVVPLLSSFSEAALAAARDAAPELPRALLVKAVPDDWRQRCRALGCVALDAHHAGVDAALVQAVHAEGMRMITYTVNDLERVVWLESIGVDAVITDAVDRIAA
jgi:glycerophosphoryl diester phosphodiesterase